MGIQLKLRMTSSNEGDANAPVQQVEREEVDDRRSERALVQVLEPEKGFFSNYVGQFTD